MIYFCTGFNYFIRVSDRKRMVNTTVAYLIDVTMVEAWGWTI